jgi:hypothetical protein
MVREIKGGCTSVTDDDDDDSCVEIAEQIDQHI